MSFEPIWYNLGEQTKTSSTFEKGVNEEKSAFQGGKQFNSSKVDRPYEERTQHNRKL